MSVVDLAVRGGVNFVHLRAPHLGGGALFALGEALQSAIGHSATLVINDRIDVAVALQTSHVQLGRMSLPISVARQSFPDLHIGASVHSVEESVAAERDGADWLLLGTIFETGSHPGQAGEGAELIRLVRRACHIPIIAIGGLNAERVSLVRYAGASGVAVISAILSSVDPRAAASCLTDALKRFEEN